MSNPNPEFKHVDGAAYELPELIKRLGDVSFSAVLTQEQMNMVDAIKTHARNTQERLHDGVSSIGHLMSLACDSDYEVGNGHVAQLGALLKHLASEADFMRVTEWDMHHIQEEQKVLPADVKSTKPKGGRE